MPTTKEMTEYRAELEAVAETVKTNLNSIASKNQDQIALEDEMEVIKYATLSQVLTARFAINNKLEFTNAEERKVALETRLTNDVNYQNLKTSRSVKVIEQSLLSAEVEYQRRKHKSLATLLLFFANNPTA